MSFKEKTCIVMNQLFSGGYLDEGENIGHEITNLIKADDQKYYLYVTPSGIVENPKSVKSVIFVRNFKDRGKVVEVVAVAPSVRVFEDNIEDITYNSIALSKLFGNNIFHGKSEHNSDETRITFIAEDGIRVPKKRILLKTKDAIFSDSDRPKDTELVSIDTNKTAIVRKMRTYIDKNNKNEEQAFIELEEMIKKEDLWDKPFSMSSEEVLGQEHAATFLEVIKKENDENVFSNLFQYFFEKNREAFINFAGEVLFAASKYSKAPTIHKNFIVEREKSFSVEREKDAKRRAAKKRIDIWIEDEENIIVIENKIKSGINGIEGDVSQLKYYFDFAEEQAREKNKTAHFFVFAPDYNGISLDRYDCGERYDQIAYSSLFNFFSENQECYKQDGVDNMLFEGFLRGLERHTKTLSVLNQETMYSRFLDAIRNINLG